MGKAVDELLEGSFGVSCDGGIISEEHLPDEDFAHLCLGSEACQVEQATVAPGVQVDALFGLAEGVAQQQGEQDAKKCRREDTPLFDAALDGEGVRGGAIVLDSTFHFLVEGGDHLGNTTRLKSISKKRLSSQLKLTTEKEKQVTTET